jgi:cellulose synthase/poly-beta-1,6-N-acetylglucosamine synthase-like glycosyltransferase
VIIAIGIPHRAQGYAKFWQQLYALERPADVTIVRLACEGTYIVTQRNNLFDLADQSGADALLTVDDDHILPKDVLTRLLARNRPIVSAHYYTRRPPHYSTAFLHIEQRKWRPISAPSAQGLFDVNDGLVKVDGVGMGCMLIRRDVWTAMDRPWCRAGQFDPRDVAEDLSFCVNARAAGFEVLVDLDLPLPHIMTCAITPEAGRVDAYRMVSLADAEQMRQPVKEPATV